MTSFFEKLGIVIVFSVAFAWLVSPAAAGTLAFYDLNDWSRVGFNSVHAIQLSGATPGGPGKSPTEFHREAERHSETGAFGNALPPEQMGRE